MKTYKLWEALEKLSKNSKLVFRTKDGRGNYTVLNMNEDYAYPYFVNYKSNGQMEKDLRAEFNGMVEIDSEWQLIQKPVTFEEVLNSDKKVRVEHSLKDFSSMKTDYDHLKEALEDFKNGMYIKLDDLLELLSSNLYAHKLREIIKNGKWYLED